MTQPNLFSGWDLAKQGMKRATEKANRQCNKWSDKAMVKLIAYLTIQHGIFQTEDFRTWAEGNGLSSPENARAYGSLMRTAVNHKIIRGVGYAPVSNPKAHCTPAKVWVKF